MSDDLNARQSYCEEQYNIISKQYRKLMLKVDAIYEAPTKTKKQKSKKNTEAAKRSTLERAQSVRAACEDLADTIREVLQELGDDVDEKEEEAAGPSGRPPAGN